MLSKATKLFEEFFESEKAGGITLMFFTIIALAVANSFLGEPYLHWLHSKVYGLSIEEWVNDGLMTIFFLLVGLELEREIYGGELSDIRNAILPVVAAIGGMLIPAAIHYSLCRGSIYERGAGIPMATDIAFSLGILALVSSRVPFSLKVFLTALAIADDLGAVIVIAVFYTKSISIYYFVGAISIFSGLCLLNRWNVNAIWVYALGGLAMWYCMLHSGVHATITGVLLGFALPFRDGSEQSPSYRLQHWLHKPIAFGLLPIFALVNTSIPIGHDWLDGLRSPNSIGIFLGLVVGKPVGITLFCWVALKSKLCGLPEDLTLSHLVGASFLAGIGFTMSIFVSILAFDDAAMINQSQIMVLIASFIAAFAGLLWFYLKVPIEDLSDAVSKSQLQ
ncbi:MAG: Na+/H+ antiporter NhaA [Pirellulaceae bacterium]|nr:Na+/H+ antiporter NhaA [Pirellulaceae bacterium]